jgi:hypothetical protein
MGCTIADPRGAGRTHNAHFKSALQLSSSSRSDCSSLRLIVCQRKGICFRSSSIRWKRCAALQLGYVEEARTETFARPRFAKHGQTA